MDATDKTPQQKHMWGWRRLTGQELRLLFQDLIWFLASHGDFQLSDTQVQGYHCPLLATKDTQCAHSTQTQSEGTETHSSVNATKPDV